MRYDYSVGVNAPMRWIRGMPGPRRGGGYMCVCARVCADEGSN